MIQETLSAKRILKYAADTVLVTIGTAITAASLQFFLLHDTIVPGGLNGLLIAISLLTEKIGYKIPVYILNLIFNVPLFIFGAQFLGKRTASLTLVSIIELSFFLKVLPEQIFTEQLILNAVFGGVVMGIGVGLVFKFGGTTGGTDLAGAIVSKYWSNLSIAKGMAITNFVIIIFAGIVNVKIETVLYSLIALFFSMRVIDMVLSDNGYFKGFFIITSRPKEVSDGLMSQLGRGVTLLHGEGMYSKQEHAVLMCVVHRAQFVRAKQLIVSVDAKAFIMICDMTEVLGEGFKRNIN